MAAYLIILNGALRDGARFTQPRILAKQTVNRLGGNILARSVDIKVREGELDPEHLVVIGFPDGKQLDKYLTSPEYQYIKTFRDENAVPYVLSVEDKIP